MNCQRTPETLIGDSLRIISINLCHFQVVPGNILRFATLLLASQHPKNPAEEVGGNENIGATNLLQRQLITTSSWHLLLLNLFILRQKRSSLCCMHSEMQLNSHSNI